MQHWLELLRAAEVIREQRNVRFPPQAGEFGAPRRDLFVRAHGPPVELRHEFRHSGKRLREIHVVTVEVVRDRDAEPRAFVLEHAAEDHVFSRNAEREERRNQRDIRVEQRAVEIEDRNERQLSAIARGDHGRMARPSAELTAGGILVPSRAARETGTGVEAQ